MKVIGAIVAVLLVVAAIGAVAGSGEGHPHHAAAAPVRRDPVIVRAETPPESATAAMGRPHPILEARAEERRARRICGYSRREAAALGPATLETYVVVCG